ncbi:hypothetical protein [Amycolatopsis sp. NPDC051903]|uniref:Rv1733c family protein n=1 Tax=Amycolatopsis sp. NPDC051903 TaxID=3363936 RepID=UPI00378F5B7E
MTVPARVVRGLRLVRPAVRRRPAVRICDRIEAVVLLVLGVLLLGSVPVCWGVGAAVFAAGRAADTRLGVRYEVTAKLFPADLPAHGKPPVVRDVHATWTAPDGAARSGLVTVELSPGAPAITQIWVDRAGLEADAPRSAGDLVFVGVMYGAAAESGCLAAAALAYAIARALLDRSRARGWESAWRRLSGSVPGVA